MWKSAGLSAELLLVLDAAGQAELTLQHRVGVGGVDAPLQLLLIRKSI